MILEVSIAFVALISLLISAMVFREHLELYGEIGSDPVDIQTKSNLQYLGLIVSIMGYLQISGYFYASYLLLDDHKMLFPTAMLGVCWLLLISLLSKLNHPRNAFIGGHFMILMTLVAIETSHVLHFISNQQSLNYEFWALMGTINLVLIFIFIFWSDRHQADDDENISKEEGASIFSRLLFSWVTPMVQKGKEKTMEKGDIPQLSKEDSSNVN